MKSALWSIGKYLLAGTLLYFIIKHAGADRILGYLKRIPVALIVLGFLIVTAALVISALRMRFFFRAAGFDMHARYALILFYVGAFYNFLLPGGIGGDAYKIILVRKRMSVTAKQGITIMLADRASGLCVVMLALCGGSLLLDLSSIPFAKFLALLGAAVTLGGYLFFCHLLIGQKPSVMLWSLPYSIAGQAFWMGAVYTIGGALGGGLHGVEYVMLYCASSITSMLPVSVGGLGIRETTYYYGAQLLRQYAHSGVDGDVGIAISLCIFFLTFVTALPGLLWLGQVEKAEYL